MSRSTKPKETEMGHYRSEMGFEEEDAKKVIRKKTARKKMAAKIKKAIEKEGIEYVLADILSDHRLTRTRFMEWI